MNFNIEAIIRIPDGTKNKSRKRIINLLQAAVIEADAEWIEVAEATKPANDMRSTVLTVRGKTLHDD